jgi:hypothetical protein
MAMPLLRKTLWATDDNRVDLDKAKHGNLFWRILKGTPSGVALAICYFLE